MTSKAILNLEKNKNWQATAKYADGRLVAVLGDQTGGQLEEMFYLYEEDWSPPIGPAGMPAYSASEIRDKFASKELTLIKGKIPD